MKEPTMALVLNRDQQSQVRESGDRQSIDRFFFTKPDKFRIVSPSGRGSLTVRIYPEPSSDGSLLPLIMGLAPVTDPKTGEVGSYAPDLSNLVQVNTVTCQGPVKERWFTGVVDPSDVPGATKFDSPFAAYIKLKGKAKKNELDQEVATEFAKMTTKPADRPAPMAGPDETLLISCAVLAVEGKSVGASPALNGVLVLKRSAITAYLDAMVRAHQAGRNPADPDNGFLVTFGQLPPDKKVGRNMAFTTCVLGATPFNGLPGQTVEGLEASAARSKVPEAILRKNWVDLRAELKLHSYRDLMAAAIKSYGELLVSTAFPTEFEQFQYDSGNQIPASQPARPATQTRPAAPARPAAPVTPEVPDALPGFGFDTAGDVPAQNPASAAAVAAANRPAVSASPAAARPAPQAQKPATPARTPAAGPADVNTLLAQFETLDQAK